eukprot:TRINITY_DN6938_c0_g1_i1.p1 TRINITY_DN6938_c0_g1~~TRINITY_DN6938_c0_g1_i1.p1  ORF type:complete len:290 (-),score=90.34 TRINITY_DN6938_c0_g1_i1:11-880(-)
MEGNRKRNKKTDSSEDLADERKVKKSKKESDSVDHSREPSHTKTARNGTEKKRLTDMTKNIKQKKNAHVSDEAEPESKKAESEKSVQRSENEVSSSDDETKSNGEADNSNDEKLKTAKRKSMWGDDEDLGELPEETVEEQDSEEGSDSEAIKPKKEKQDKPTKKSFAEAMSSILNTETPSENPILAESGIVQRKDKMQAKLLEKEKTARSISDQKTALLNARHVIPEVILNEQEYRLRKIATKGVVQLLNAIKTARATAPKKLDKRSMEKLTNESFLDLLRNPAKKEKQ